MNTNAPPNSFMRGLNMKYSLAAIALALFVSGCSNTWQGVKQDSSEIYESSKETVHEATE
jgi:predicted small secreted protein